MSAQQPESRPTPTPESARPTPESARPTTTPESARPTTTPESARPTTTFYEAVGGEPFFSALVGRFYEGVAGDPELRRLYPEEDLTDAEERLRLFLIQYWGGPTTYGQQRGHPRLRMRHAPFVIGPAERDAWLRHMGDAVDSMDLPPELRKPLWDYLFGAAYAMQNSA